MQFERVNKIFSYTSLDIALATSIINMLMFVISSNIKRNYGILKQAFLFARKDLTMAIVCEFSFLKPLFLFYLFIRFGAVKPKPLKRGELLSFHLSQNPFSCFHQILGKYTHAFWVCKTGQHGACLTSQPGQSWPGPGSFPGET